MMRRAIYITRIVIFVLTSFLSLVTLGLAARILAFDASVGVPGEDHWAGMALASALLTKIALIASLITTYVAGPTTWVSWSSIELGVLGFLWLLWLSSAAWTTSTFGPHPLGSCDLESPYVVNLARVWRGITLSTAESVCQSIEGIMACSWIVWLLLTALIIWEIVVVLQALRAGHTGIWTSALWMYDARRPPETKGAGGPFNNVGGYAMGDQGQGHVAPSHFVGQQQGYAPMPSSGMGQQGGMGGGQHGGMGQQGMGGQYGYAAGGAPTMPYSQPQYDYSGQTGWSGKAAEV